MEKRENISGDMHTNNKASAFSVKISVAKKYDTADNMFRSVNTVRELSPPLSTEESVNTSEEVLSSNQSKGRQTDVVFIIITEWHIEIPMIRGYSAFQNVKIKSEPMRGEVRHLMNQGVNPVVISLLDDAEEDKKHIEDMTPEERRRNENLN